MPRKVVFAGSERELDALAEAFQDALVLRAATSVAGQFMSRFRADPAATLLVGPQFSKVGFNVPDGTVPLFGKEWVERWTATPIHDQTIQRFYRPTLRAKAR